MVASKSAPRGPKRRPRGPKTPPRGSKRPPRAPQEAPRGPQETPRAGQEGSKPTEELPRASQDAHKVFPKHLARQPFSEKSKNSNHGSKKHRRHLRSPISMNPKGLASTRRMKKGGRAAVIPLGEVNKLFQTLFRPRWRPKTTQDRSKTGPRSSWIAFFSSSIFVSIFDRFGIGFGAVLASQMEPLG